MIIMRDIEWVKYTHKHTAVVIESKGNQLLHHLNSWMNTHSLVHLMFMTYGKLVCGLVYLESNCLENEFKFYFCVIDIS